MPKLWLLNEKVDGHIWSDHFEVLPGDVFKQSTNPFTGKREGPGAKEKRAAKSRKELSAEGAVSCLKMSEWGADPELLVGFESGAIALCSLIVLSIDESGKDEEGQSKYVKVTRLFSGQKFVQDLSMRHILSMEPIHFGDDHKNPEFKLCIGYYHANL
jgi:hypothetical protein